ncbi:protein of unknown function (plasmid) [Pararobbsia alpina]
MAYGPTCCCIDLWCVVIGRVDGRTSQRWGLKQGVSNAPRGQGVLTAMAQGMSPQWSAFPLGSHQGLRRVLRAR